MIQIFKILHQSFNLVEPNFCSASKGEFKFNKKQKLHEEQK